MGIEAETLQLEGRDLVTKCANHTPKSDSFQFAVLKFVLTTMRKTKTFNNLIIQVSRLLAVQRHTNWRHHLYHSRMDRHPLHDRQTHINTILSIRLPTFHGLYPRRSEDLTICKCKTNVLKVQDIIRYRIKMFQLKDTQLQHVNQRQLKCYMN